VLPLQFKGNESVQSLGITGDEEFHILGVDADIKPQQDVTMVIERNGEERQQVKLLLRIDTPIEVDYYANGGILPYVLLELLRSPRNGEPS
jgi:aconitate hydratase